jgi:hypothetical protein
VCLIEFVALDFLTKASKMRETVGDNGIESIFGIAALYAPAYASQVRVIRVAHISPALHFEGGPCV